MKHHPVLKLFLRYAAVDSKSGVNKGAHPTSPGQTKLIKMIQDDLMAHGITPNQLRILKDGSLLVHFPGTKKGKTVCYAAHMDTSPEASGGGKCIIHNYKGGKIVLPKGGIVIPSKDLAGKKGKTIVTGNGKFIPGADDKAGVAILVQIARDLAGGFITAHHPPVYMWFCVDEEVGQLDISVVPPKIVRSWDAFITLDGGHPQGVDTDCFCGWETIVEFFGQSAHPGEGGKKLKPAHYAMAQLIQELEGFFDAPWRSTGLDSFVYVAEVTEMTSVHARAEIIPRSFVSDKLSVFHNKIVAVAKDAAGDYSVTCNISGRGLTYVGTGTAIKNHPEVLVPIRIAIREVVGEPYENSVRGGTDGAMANKKYPDLPAPNLGVGMYNFHGVREFLVVEEMLAMYNVMQKLIPAY